MEDDNRTMYFDSLRRIMDTIKMNNIQLNNCDEYEIYKIKMLFKDNIIRKFKIRVISNISEYEFVKLLLGSLTRTRLKGIIKMLIYNDKFKQIYNFNNNINQLNILRNEMIKNYVGQNIDSINAIIKL